MTGQYVRYWQRSVGVRVGGITVRICWNRWWCNWLNGIGSPGDLTGDGYGVDKVKTVVRLFLGGLEGMCLWEQK